MKKIASVKLKLDRTTIRALTGATLGAAAGGTSTSCNDSECYTAQCTSTCATVGQNTCSLCGTQKTYCGGGGGGRYM